MPDRCLEEELEAIVDDAIAENGDEPPLSRAVDGP